MSDIINNPAKFDNALLAERYDRISNSQFENGVFLIKELGIQTGDNALDIGCGTGRLGVHVLGIIGKNGHVIGLDPSEHRIKIAQQKVKAFSNASFKLGSDSTLNHFAGNSFDVVYINAVFHHIVDKSSAITQIKRILKPGGRLGIADPAKEFPSTIRTITKEVLQPYELNSFNDELVTTNELQSLLVSTGFQIIKSNYRKNIRYYETPRHIIEFIEASDFGNYLSQVPEFLRASVKADIAAKLEKYQTEKGIEFTGYTNYVIAQKRDGAGFQSS